MASWACCGSRAGKGGKTDSNGIALSDETTRDLTAIEISKRLAAFTPSENVDTQHIQWYEAIERRFGSLKPKTAALLLSLCDNDDLRSSIEFLDKEYRSHSIISRLQRLEPTLANLNSLERGLTSLAHAGPFPIQVLWGSTLLLIKITLRHQDTLDKIVQMLERLTSSMPRFETYLNLYPTAQLRQVMRHLYDDFISFVLTSADFLSGGVYGNLFRLSWQSIDQEFSRMRESLQMHKDEFENEARLAVIQANNKWQEEIRMKISKTVDSGTASSTTGHTSSTSSSPTRVISMLPFPRNLMFTGRDDIFHEINEALLSRIDSTQRSVALVGMGGVGKTQIALEYAYRFKGNYSHLFWIKSETEIDIRQSFSAMARKLDMLNAGVVEQKDIEATRAWLETDAARWLLIFDNVHSVSLVRQYWPQTASRGSILVTSQRKSLQGLSSSQISIHPFSLEEGSNLVLSQMHLGESSREQAKALSAELGGSPLAIAHYTGFCVTSHISLEEVLKTFHRRSMTAEVWSNKSDTSLMQYERTLQTVWDTSLSGLRSNTRDLLNVLAFLNPDYIPEDLLAGCSRFISFGPQTTESFGLTVIISDLSRRNLVRRNIETTLEGGSLQLHRSLRLSLLLAMDLDPEKRQVVFENAMGLVRAAFPRRDMTSRNPENEPIWKRHMVQVLSLQSAFERSDPPIAGTMEFASLLCDAGSFLWEQQLSKTSFSVLSLAEKIATSLVEDDDPNPILASIFSYLAVLTIKQSVEQREAGISRLKGVVELRESFLKSLSSPTIEQQVDVGRSWNDLGYHYLDMERFDEADELMTKALDLYKTLGDESTLRFRFAIQYISFTPVRVGQGRIDEALDLASRSYKLFIDELGPEHLETARMEAEWGYALLASGDYEAALMKFSAVLAVRSKRLENDNPDVLTAKYWIGTVYYYLDRLIEAEKYVREAVSFSTRSGMAEEDLVRANYRLALILDALGQRNESLALEEEARDYLSEKGLPRDSGQDAIIEILDRRVYVENGRSTGPFKGRRVGKL